jgi:Rubredoxin NAD+ reductase C-terminal domain
VCDLLLHVVIFFLTHLFSSMKVVLLGRYNAQGLGSKTECSARTTLFTREGLNVQSKEFSLMPDLTGTKEAAHLKDTRKVEIWTRTTPCKEYVKLVIFEGKVVGALLMGDTGLEEVFENLILNQLDVSHLGIDLLDPTLDLEDYFD